MDKMLSAMAESLPEGGAFFDMLGELQDEERYALIKEILTSENMFVTPKDVDAVIFRLANIIANTLNIALHPGITTEDVNRYIC